MLAAMLTAAGVAPGLDRNCDGGVCYGTSGADVLYGSSVKDTIYGLGGDDKVVGRGGDDGLKGGPKRDRVNGGEGDDRVRGTLGTEVVYGGPGDDLVRGGDPERPNDGVKDVLDCGPGVDTVYFTPGQDVVRDNCEIENPPAPWVPAQRYPQEDGGKEKDSPGEDGENRRVHTELYTPVSDGACGRLQSVSEVGLCGCRRGDSNPHALIGH